MGLTNNQMEMIKAVSSNDLHQAKLCAKACLAEDTTQKNRAFVSRYKSILNGEPEHIQVPPALTGKLIVEEAGETFLEKRYFVSEREKELFDTIQRMRLVSEKLSEKNIPYINAAILYGESGTGKTTFGRYAAYKLGLPFAYLNFSTLIDSLLGKTSANLSVVFHFVKSFPCVFMIDEVDCISLARGAHGNSDAGGELNRTTITLMQEFDQLPNDIVVLAGTNRIDQIDKAFLRRFSLQHEIKAFSAQDSQKMVRGFLEDAGLSDMFKEEADQKLLTDIIEKERVQGRIMSTLVREIGARLLSENEEG